MKLSLQGSVATRKLACLRACRRFCVSRFGYPLPGGVFPGNCVGSKSSRWLTLIILSKARSIAGYWTPRGYRVSALTPSGATHSARGACCTTKCAVVGWPKYLRSASQSRLLTRQSGPSAVSIPISPPRLGHLLVSFSVGILSPWPIISFTGGTRRKAAPN